MENQCGAELISWSDTGTVVFHCVRCYTGEINLYMCTCFLMMLQIYTVIPLFHISTCFIMVHPETVYIIRYYVSTGTVQLEVILYH